MGDENVVPVQISGREIARQEGSLEFDSRAVIFFPSFLSIDTHVDM